MTRNTTAAWLLVSILGLITNHLLAYANGPSVSNGAGLACFAVSSLIWLYLLWTGDDE